MIREIQSIVSDMADEARDRRLDYRSQDADIIDYWASKMQQVLDAHYKNQSDYSRHEEDL